MSKNNTAFYRNTTEIMDQEPDTLWEKTGENFVLVNDDEHITLPVEGNEDNFYKVEVPDEAFKH